MSEFNGVEVEDLEKLREKVSHLEAALVGLPDKLEKLEKAKLGAAAFHDEPTEKIHREIENLERRKRELEAEKWFIEKNVIPTLEREKGV